MCSWHGLCWLEAGRAGCCAAQSRQNSASLHIDGCPCTSGGKAQAFIHVVLKATSIPKVSLPCYDSSAELQRFSSGAGWSATAHTWMSADSALSRGKAMRKCCRLRCLPVLVRLRDWRSDGRVSMRPAGT